MDTSSVEVLRVDTERLNINFAHPEAGAEIRAAFDAIAGKGYVPPLAPERVTVEVKGVPTAVPNALRRVVKDEMVGHCLTFDSSDLDRKESTDPFMLNEMFIRTRIQMIRLRPQISESIKKDLRLALDAKNSGTTVMSVYAGDLVLTGGELSEPIFNPTCEIASLQPGKTLKISNIRVSEGRGSDNGAFTVAIRSVSKPLDLEEFPTSDTHPAGAKASRVSGFKISSLVANPRRHQISFIIPAAPRGRDVGVVVFLEACRSILGRLRYIQIALENSQNDSSRRSTKIYFLSTPDGGRTKGVLGVAGETHTIGNLLARAVYELMPDIGYVGYTCIPHEGEMRLTVAHSVSEPSELRVAVLRAVKHCTGIFNKIQSDTRKLSS